MGTAVVTAPYATSRFVCMLDLLGYRGLARERQGSELVGIMRNLAASVPREVDRYGRAATGLVVYADTFVIYSHGRSHSDFHSVLLSSVAFMSEALRRGLGVRGALSFGELIHEGSENMSLMAGQALVEAEEWEKRQEWVGAAVTPDCWKHIIGEQPGLDAACIRYLEDYNVPLKEAGSDGPGVRDMKALDWPTWEKEFGDDLESIEDNMRLQRQIAENHHVRTLWNNGQLFLADRRHGSKAPLVDPMVVKKVKEALVFRQKSKWEPEPAKR